MNTGIYTSSEIGNALDEAINEVCEYIREQADPLFEAASGPGKWTTGQQLSHLIKSIAPINQGLSLPKFLLRLRFGTSDHTERSYEALKDQYLDVLDQGGKASTRYIPEPVPADQKEVLLDEYLRQKETLIKKLNTWDEKALSSYFARHPLLGMLTIRELMFFTIYHNYHHLNQLREIR